MRRSAGRASCPSLLAGREHLLPERRHCHGLRQVPSNRAPTVSRARSWERCLVGRIMAGHSGLFEDVAALEVVREHGQNRHLVFRGARLATADPRLKFGEYLVRGADSRVVARTRPGKPRPTVRPRSRHATSRKVRNQWRLGHAVLDQAGHALGQCVGLDLAGRYSLHGGHRWRRLGSHRFKHDLKVTEAQIGLRLIGRREPEPRGLVLRDRRRKISRSSSSPHGSNLMPGLAFSKSRRSF